jgi:macrolide transport system ATP-binding/permease protein
MPAPTHLLLDGVSFAYADRPVLTDLSLTAPSGARLGLIGENGSGKSTLLHCAAGVLAPDRGTIQRPDRTGLLHQELPFAASDTLATVIHQAVAPVRALLSEVERLAHHLDDLDAAAAYDEALTAAERADAWAIDARIAAVLAGLGLDDVAPARELGSISGGQRSRLALAALLLSHPTLLLLDEPTNHLDEDALDFLATELRTWPGPLLFASHDRVFLDEVATGVVDLDPAPGPRGELVQGRRYTGAYSAYLRARARDRERWRCEYAEQQDERHRLEHLVDVGAQQIFHTTAAKSEARIARKFYGDRAAKTIGGRLRSARNRLAALNADRMAEPPEPLRFAGFTGRAPVAGIAVTMAEVSVEARLQPVSLQLRTRDRVLVTGGNGVGKSTLLAVLEGSLPPDTGQRLARPGLRIRRLAQDVAWPEPWRTPAELADRRGVAEQFTGLGLVRPGDLGRAVAELSVGTQRRVALALLVADPPEVLLLDEPTNHLALSLAEELEAALPDYPGAIVVTSHDRWLRRRWRGRMLNLQPDVADFAEGDRLEG